MKIVRLQVKNFMSIGDIDMELDKIGMNLVLGRNEDDKRFDSNGAAKSALFEAMSWGLFGEILRDLPIEGIVRKGADIVLVNVLVDPEDGTDRVWFKRQRGKRDHLITVTAETTGMELFPANSVRDIQSQINNWLGLDFKTFTNSVYFGKGLVKFFMASNDTERKDLLETILQLVSFDDALERAKALSKKCEFDIAEYNTALAVAVAVTDEKIKQSRAIEIEKNRIETRIEKEHPLLIKKIITFQNSKVMVDRNLKELEGFITNEKGLCEEVTQIANEEHSEIQKGIDKRLREGAYVIDEGHSKKVQEVEDNFKVIFENKSIEDNSLNGLVIELNSTIYEYNVEYAREQTSLAEICKRKNHILSLTENIPCKHCLQNISIDHKQELIKEYDEERKDKDNNLANLKEGIQIMRDRIREEYGLPKEKLEKDIVRITTEKNLLIETLQKEKFEKYLIFSQMIDVEREHENKAYNLALKNIQENYYNKVRNWTGERNDFSIKSIQLDNDMLSLTRQIADNEVLYYSLKKQEADIQKEIDKVVNHGVFVGEKIQATQVIKARTDFWIEGFGPRGIKSFIFEAALPYLTERANHYSSYITGGTVAIDISPTTMVKSKGKGHPVLSKEKLFVSAKNKHGSNLYNGNSDGERRRIDICVILALRDLISTRASKKWSTLIFDEILDCLDVTGIEHILDLFRTLPNQSIYIISHNSDLKKNFDTSITIVKKDGVSSLE